MAHTKSAPPVYQGFGLKVAPILDEVDYAVNELPAEVANSTVVTEDAPVEELPDFMVGHELSYVEGLDEAEYTTENVHNFVDSPDKANLISSKIKGKRKHKIILDLDVEAKLIPSSTPGHSHLYIDLELTEDQMEKFLFACHDVGLIADGNVGQWERFKAVFLRLPWIKKGPDATPDDDSPKD